MIPVITLNNGLRVCNFSSPHPFNFDTGEVLPACDPERSRTLMLECTEKEVVGEKWVDIEVQYSMSEVVEKEIQELTERDDVDIILVPLPVLMAVRERPELKRKVRGIRVADRVSKAVYSDRFCV